jgi:hypothetical protein
MRNAPRARYLVTLCARAEIRAALEKVMVHSKDRRGLPLGRIFPLMD